ncbi:MAG: hypothetical protein H6708_11485 [Kofleriaceae bacterium]|nr:hypothetical protein [Kofleriaceae bacterium]
MTTVGNTGAAASEPRALASALSASTPFAGRAASAALHASERHVDRWAPERDATSRSRGLGTLAFADRLLKPWLAAAQSSRPRGRTIDRTTPSVSWLFPRPWYQDELDWAAAEREAEGQSQAGVLTTRGTYLAQPAGMAPRSVQHAVVRPPGAAAAAAGDEGTERGERRVATPDLAYVAPSMAPSAAWPTTVGARAARGLGPSPASTGAGAAIGGAGLAAAMRAAPQALRALRAWSAEVPFAAAQAAELVAGTVASAERAGLAAQSPLLEGLAYVAPSEIAAASQPGPQLAHRPRPSRRWRAAPSSPRSRAPRGREVAPTSAPNAPQLPQLAALYQAEQARAAAQVREASPAPAAPSSEVAAAAATSAPTPAEGRGHAVVSRRGRAERGRRADVGWLLARRGGPGRRGLACARRLAAVARAGHPCCALGGGLAPVSGPRVALPPVSAVR